MDHQGAQWNSLWTEVLEECHLRGFEFPGPIDIEFSKPALDNTNTRVPDLHTVLEKHNIKNKFHLLKFGEIQFLEKSMKSGEFQISSASSYDSASHNHARRDKELSRTITPHPNDSKANAFLHSINRTSPSGKYPSEITIESSTDYYLFSLCYQYTPRLFGDFHHEEREETACLVFYNYKEFCKRLVDALKLHLGSGWDYCINAVTYFDPVRCDASLIDIPHFKPFRHAYQHELRITAIPFKPRKNLDSFFVKLGSLECIAEIVCMATNPPVITAYDHSEHSLVRFGSINEDSEMINNLPEVSRMQGIILNRPTNNHENWYFEIQYTDDEDSWHALKIPMLDGLYLLNLLEGAEKEQHLGLWNRKPK